MANFYILPNDDNALFYVCTFGEKKTFFLGHRHCASRLSNFPMRCVGETQQKSKRLKEEQTLSCAARRKFSFKRIKNLYDAR